MEEKSVNTEENWFESFISNYYSEREDAIHTAMKNEFYNGHRSLPFDDLVEGVVGINLLMTKNLTALIGYEDELKAGKQVDVYVRYVVDKERSEHVKVDVLRVEVLDPYYD